MPPEVINLDELEFHDWKNGERFEGRMGEIAEVLGACKLGYNLTVVPAGKRAFPMHCHHAIEEMFFILEGQGELRSGSERRPLRPGDVVCCPAGGLETAHQIINTMSAGDLKYLAVSTTDSPDICQYPDSGKTLVHHCLENDGKDSEGRLRFILGREEGRVDYWEDED